MVPKTRVSASMLKMIANGYTASFTGNKIYMK